MARRIGARITAVVAAVCLALVLTLAVISRGYPIRKLDLNDSGIWVTNGVGQQLGRVNKSAVGLDAWLDVPGSGAKRSFDVLQDGNAVVQYDQTQRALVPVDSASVLNLNESSLQLPPDALVDLRGGTLAVLDPATGKVFATRYDARDSKLAVHGIDFEGAAVADLGAAPSGVARPAALSVGADGSVHAALANGKTATIPVVAQGFGGAQVAQLKQSLKSVQVAALGARTIVYDAEQGLVVLPNGTAKELPLDPAGVIQPGGEDDGRVLIALSSGLFRVGLDDGVATQLASGMSGAPAAPVRVAGCDFGAWAGGTGSVVRACGDAATAEELGGVRSSGALTKPVFRVNRNQLVLNDAADGRTFDLATQNRLDNWDTIKPKANEQSQNPNQQVKPKPQEAKPVANPDTVGVRPGRSAIGYVLDNDTDALGQILMITGVSRVPEGAGVTIAPDGQSLVVRPPVGSAGFSFSYTISNGHNGSESTVRVEVRPENDNAKPVLRPGYQDAQYAVASFGTLPLSVLSDWRDTDGDSLTLVSAEVDGTPAPVTPEGRIEYVAGREDAKVVRTLTYLVTDGLSAPVEHKLPITILEAKSLVGTPPVVFADAVRGQVGKPISFNPLANDLPGSDPRTPDARLRLGGAVKPEAGLEVRSDLFTGQVTVTAAAAGSYELTYAAAFGSSAMQAGKIRVDVTEASTDNVPVVLPDQVTLRGAQGARLDPLANDADPLGGILTVTGTEADPSQLDVAVISGRWVLVTPKAGQLATNPTVVRYTVTNGQREATGEITVSQLAPLPDQAPIVKDDIAAVRAGDSVLVNVLANDIAPAGEQLTLVTNFVGQATPGQLTLYDPAQGKGTPTDLGTAYVHNNHIRYVAPATVEAERQVVIEYYAQLPSGRRSPTGKVLVTVKPQPATEADDRAPMPEGIEARVNAGDRVKISIATGSQDPDGDSVMLVGLGSAPKLGRVVGQSPTSITYEAYPNTDNFGTDTFTVLVADRFGKASPALVRVGVTPPGQAQRPIAVADNVIASPGAIVRVDALANDLYSRADKVTIAPLDGLNSSLPAGVKLLNDDGPIEVQAPFADAQPVLLAYAPRGNGGVGVPASIKLIAQDGYKIPPVIYDEVAKADGKVATAELLGKAWDPDGKDDELTAKLLGGPADATVVGGKVTVPLTGQPQVIPYLVTDKTGAVSAAVLFVPSSGTAAPHLIAGGLIALDQNQSRSFKLSDYVTSPRERPVVFTPKTDSRSASPEGKLEVEVTGTDTFKVTAKADYVGPGAVTFEVMDSASVTDEGVLTAYVSVPVQVGPSTPVLRCPEKTVTLDAGGRDQALDIATLCHVWAPNPSDIPKLEYTIDWQGTALGEVEVTGGAHLTMRAGGGALPGATGTVLVGIAGTKAIKQPINLVVRKAPLATMRSQSFTDIMQGTPVRVPLGLDSPLRDAKLSVVSLEQESGPASQHEINGTTVTITPAANVHGDIVYRVVATDIADTSRTDRWVRATITLKVYGIPDKPAPPGVGQRAQSKAESLTWAAPAENGAPITAYRVVDSHGKTTDCPAISCRITGLTNGDPVSFQVQALNKAGWGPLSDPSPTVIPDEPPPAPTGLVVSDPRDKQLTLSWQPVVFDGTKVTSFYIIVDGKTTQVPGSALSATVATPSNNQQYAIQLIAENRYDKGPSATITGQSAGAPLGLQPPTVTPQSATGAATAVKVAWNSDVDKNGPADLTFGVVRDGTKTICAAVRTTSCTDDSVTYDGASHTYVVTATNGAGGPTHSSTSQSTWVAVGVPETPSAPTVTATGVDRQLHVVGQAGDSRGQSSSLVIFVNGGEVARQSISARGANINQNILVPSNGSSSTVTLQICNETRCGTVSQGASAVAYGPINGLSIADAGTSGTKVSYRVSVDPNGKAVNVVVNGRTFTTGTSAWSTTVSEDLGAWSTSRQYTATASDGLRSAGPTSVTLASGPQPLNPSVTVFAGDRHNDTDCVTIRCHYVMVTTKDLSGTVTCRVSNYQNPQGVWTGNSASYTWTQGPNETKNSGTYYGYYAVEVTCGSVKGYNMNWPS